MPFFVLVTRLKLGGLLVVTGALFCIIEVTFRKHPQFVCEMLHCATTLQIAAATDISDVEMYDKNISLMTMTLLRNA